MLCLFIWLLILLFIHFVVDSLSPSSFFLSHFSFFLYLPTYLAFLPPSLPLLSFDSLFLPSNSTSSPNSFFLSFFLSLSSNLTYISLGCHSCMLCEDRIFAIFLAFCSLFSFSSAVSISISLLSSSAGLYLSGMWTLAGIPS